MVNEIADLIRSFDLQNIHLAQPILNVGIIARYLKTLTLFKGPPGSRIPRHQARASHV